MLKDLLTREDSLFLIDDNVADDLINKKQQPLFELAISGLHKDYSLIVVIDTIVHSCF